MSSSQSKLGKLISNFSGSDFALLVVLLGMIIIMGQALVILPGYLQARQVPFSLETHTAHMEHPMFEDNEVNKSNKLPLRGDPLRFSS